MSGQDDLAPWADDDLVRALRAPGTATELADQEQYVAAFRDAQGTGAKAAPLARRTIGRLGAGGTAVVMTVALTGGVAAAYTGHLPDPVQQIAHHVIGAPAPTGGSGRHEAGRGPSSRVTPPPPSGSSASGDPSGPSTTPTTGPTAPTTGLPGQPDTGGDPTHGASNPIGAPSLPTGSPSASSTAPATVGTPAGMTAGGPSAHRVPAGGTVTLSATLTATDGTPLPDYPVVLQVRGPHGWRGVARTTTDAYGAAATVTPPVTRTARYRWRADHHVHSQRWLVLMVPSVSASAGVGGATTVISATTVGGTAGDTVQLFRKAGHGAHLVRVGSLDANGAASFDVATPRRHVGFVVRLAPTGLHTGARARVAVAPPAAASVSVSAATHQVTVGGSLTMTGSVVAADGTGLGGRKVQLQVRGPHRWLRVGVATTSPAGTVAVTTPSASHTARYRLRAGNGVHSAPWRVAMVPTLSATSAASGSSATVSVSAQGGRPGDRVVLLRRKAGRLVPVQHAGLSSSGTVSFEVARLKRSTTYVVRLKATRVHAPASAKVTVSGTR